MANTMLAAVFKGNGVLELEERPVPQIQKDDDIILEVGGVGICGSDLQILQVPPKHPAKSGVILGHEFAGRIVEMGKGVSGLKPGDRVAVDQNPGCGKCKMCRSGFTNACIPLFNNPEVPEPGWPNTPGQWWDGAMAKYIRIPAHYVYPISQHVPIWHVAVFEPLGVVVNGMSKIRPKVGDTACVLGAGPIGLFAVSLLKANGASRIIVSEPSEIRRRIAKDCGADVLIDPMKEDVKEIVARETKGEGVNVVVEGVGHLLPLALDVAAFDARVLQIGIPSANINFRPFQIYSKELQIYGSFLMKHATNDTIRILESGLIPMDKIVTHRLPLEKVHEAIEMSRNAEAGKVVITPSIF